MRKMLMAVHHLVFVSLLFAAATEVNGQHWRPFSRPTTRDLLRLTFLDSARGWVSGREGVILRTTNGGRSWAAQNSGVTTDIFRIVMVNERFGWALTWVDFVDTLTFYGTRILRTTDGGTTWTNARFPISGKYFYSITFVDSSTGFMCGEGGNFQRSTNGGVTWIPSLVDTIIFSQAPALNVQFFSRSFGFGMGGLIDFVGVVWRTTNGGERWIASGVSPEPVYQMHPVDSLNIIAIAGDYDFGASMMRSSDAGLTWEYTFLGIFGKPQAISFRTPSEGWVPLTNNVMATYDTGTTWEVPDTLGHRQMSDLVFTDSLTGFAVSDSGYFFKFNRMSVPVEEEIAGLPTSIRLFQNHPNPFNPATRISFTLNRSVFVSLKVYDVLGREIETLVNEVRRPGEHHVVWNASRLAGTASGIYFARLSAGSYVDVKKMALIR